MARPVARDVEVDRWSSMGWSSEWNSLPHFDMHLSQSRNITRQYTFLSALCDRTPVQYIKRIKPLNKYYRDLLEN